MLTQIKRGRIYDPINGIDGAVQDIYNKNGKIADKPLREGKIDETINAYGLIVVPGGIDIHTHIGGGKVNIARMMMTE